MSTPESEKGKPSPKMVRITRRGAATGQLESAILLWFLEQNVASIHTLAVAAQTLLHQVGKTVGKPSATVEWLESQPPSFQRQARDAQNFFKHAHKDPKRILTYAPLIAEIYIMDAIWCYWALYDFMTPLMLTFVLRFSLSNPDILPPDDSPVKLPKRLKIEATVADLGRQEFLDVFLPWFIKHC